MICDRCYQPADVGEHGVFLCPLETRLPATAVWADDIPGGIDIAHGICNADGSPRRYYSRTAIKKALRAKGLIAYHDYESEQGEGILKDARVHDDWLRSGEAQRARRDRVEQRRERQRARA